MHVPTFVRQSARKQLQWIFSISATISTNHKTLWNFEKWAILWLVEIVEEGRESGKQSYKSTDVCKLKVLAFDATILLVEFQACRYKILAENEQV